MAENDDFSEMENSTVRRQDEELGDCAWAKKSTFWFRNRTIGSRDSSGDARASAGKVPLQLSISAAVGDAPDWEHEISVPITRIKLDYSLQWHRENGAHAFTMSRA